MKKWYRLLRYDWPMHFVLLLTNWLPDNVIFMKMRGLLTRPFFKSCGYGVTLGRDITFYNPSKITLGNKVYIAKGCWLLGHEEINIGDEVLLGPYVVIVTANHSYKNGSYHAGPIVDNAPVFIDSGAWISAHCTLLPGSVIQHGVLIGANSVFRGQTEPGGVYAGVPAHIIKKIKI